MAYFSNGTAGMVFQEAFCDQCANYIERDDGKEGPGCPIWDAHLLATGTHDKDGKRTAVQELLDVLISEGDKMPPEYNCWMFRPLVAASVSTDAELLASTDHVVHGESARHFNHKFERGPYGVCRRCGDEKHPGPGVDS